MFQGLRKKEIGLIICGVLFILGFAFYKRFIAPKIGENTRRSLELTINRTQKRLDESRSKLAAKEAEAASVQAEIEAGRKEINRLRKEADIFKQRILSDKYEIELFQYLFGRDARYNVMGLGNTQRRTQKGSNYLEINYNYRVKGQFPDLLKLVQKIEDTASSLSISNLSLQKPVLGRDQAESDGSVMAEIDINVIMSNEASALTFDEFIGTGPELVQPNIEGNPWDEGAFTGMTRTSEGPTADIRRLWLQAVMYLYDDTKKAVKFEERNEWFREGDEFEIEPGKSATKARIIAIGGSYVVIRHLNKNTTFKMTLNVMDGEEASETRNIKEVIDFRL
jgi:hypothetical protein